MNIILDNYNIIYFINFIKYLVLDIFRKATKINIIKARISVLKVLSYKIRHFKNILYKIYRKYIKNLILENIIIINKFYINIILKIHF